MSEKFVLPPTSAHAALLAGSCTIVVPAYNESNRISATLEKILAHINQRGWPSEIIVVDDGSDDETANLVRQYAARNPALRLVENQRNRGKGYSVRTGMLRARGDILLFSDADLSAPIDEAEKLFSAIAQCADIAIGSRWLNVKLQVRRQPPHRQLFGRMFNVALRILLGLNFKDTQCGFKAFTREAAQKVFTAQVVEGWAFDPELLYLAKRHKLRVAEVPVRWSHGDGTRVNALRDGVRMLSDILFIRCNALRGKYPVCRDLKRAA